MKYQLKIFKWFRENSAVYKNVFAKKVLLPATIVGLVGAAAGVGLAFSGLTAGASVFWTGSIAATIRTLASIGLVGGFGLTVGGLIAGNQITKAIHRRALNKHKGWTNEEVLQTLNGDYSYENIKSLTNLPVNAFINKIIETQNKIRNSHNPIANYFRRRRNRNRLHSLASFEDKLRNSKNADTDKVGVTNALLNYIEEFRQTNLENSYARRLLTGKKVFEDADIYGKHNPNLGTRKNVKKDKEAVYSRVRELMPKFVESHIFGNGKSDALNYEQLGINKSKIVDVYSPDATVSYKKGLYRPLTKEEKKPLLKRIKEIDKTEARSNIKQTSQEEGVVQTFGSGLKPNPDQVKGKKSAKRFRLRKNKSEITEEVSEKTGNESTISTFGNGNPTSQAQQGQGVNRQRQTSTFGNPNVVQTPTDSTTSAEKKTTIPRFVQNPSDDYKNLRERASQGRNNTNPQQPVVPQNPLVLEDDPDLAQPKMPEIPKFARKNNGKEQGQPQGRRNIFEEQPEQNRSNKQSKAVNNNPAQPVQQQPAQPVQPVQQQPAQPVQPVQQQTPENENNNNNGKPSVFDTLINGANKELEKGKQSKTEQSISSQPSVVYNYNGLDQSYLDSSVSGEVESSQSITYSEGQSSKTTKKTNSSGSKSYTATPVEGEAGKYYIGKDRNIKARRIQGTNYYVDEEGNVRYTSGNLVSEKKLVNIRIPGKDNGDTLTVTAVDKNGKTYQGTVSRKNSSATSDNDNNVDNPDDVLKP